MAIEDVDVLTKYQILTQMSTLENPHSLVSTPPPSPSTSERSLSPAMKYTTTVIPSNIRPCVTSIFLPPQNVPRQKNSDKCINRPPKPPLVSPLTTFSQPKPNLVWRPYE